MDHQQFAARAKEALRVKSEGRIDDALVQIKGLLEDLKAPIKASVNAWHQQQVLTLLVDALDAAGKHNECHLAWEELIEFSRGEFNYWDEALSSAQRDFERWKNESKDH